jgi:lantibiotic modifying enzyme
MSDATVCCGRGGAVELLILADEEEAARMLATSVVRAAGVGGLVGSHPGVHPLLLGFHRGLAGIGYMLLRAMSPSEYPSVLTWR